MAFDRDESAGYLANQMARLFAQALHARIRPLGLAPAQFMTLLALWEEDGLTQSDLVGRLDVEQATMANTLARMERDGLIRRLPNPDDGRSRHNWMTDRAKALEGPATAAADAVNAVALGPLSDRQHAAFLDFMRHAIARLQQDRSG